MTATARKKAPRNLRSYLLQGERRVVEHADLSLRVVGDRFEMQSPHTGKHSLLIIATDEARLRAHWKGFKSRG